MTVTRDHDVVRLEIAMHDTGRMGLSESFGDVLQTTQKLSQVSLHDNRFAQSLAVYEFHRDKVCGIALADLIDVRNVRMIERCRGLRLLFETPPPIVIGGHLW